MYRILIFCALLFLWSCGGGETATSEGNGSAANSEQADGPEDGEQLTHHADGSVKTRVNYLNGRRNGPALTYYPGGKTVMYSIEYQNGVKHGDNKAFYKDGTPNRVVPFKNGRKNGVEKKYWPNGKVASEKTWRNDQLGTGLKEYKKDGSLLKKNIPEIVITTEDQTALSGIYSINLKLKDGNKAVSFYIGELTDGQFMHDDLKELTTTGGKASYNLSVAKGGFLMEKVNVIAKVKTYYKNYHIVQKSINVAVNN